MAPQNSSASLHATDGGDGGGEAGGAGLAALPLPLPPQAANVKQHRMQLKAWRTRPPQMNMDKVADSCVFLFFTKPHQEEHSHFSLEQFKVKSATSSRQFPLPGIST
jgi:hypothetical protein